MIQFSKHIWTSRFLLLMGLVLAGQIILGIIVFIVLGQSYARTELTLAALLLVGGIVVLDWLREVTPRKIVLSAGLFVLIALLFLMALSGLQARVAGRVPSSLLQQYLLPVVLVLALLAFLGKIISRKIVLAQEPSGGRFLFEPSPPPVYWFERIGHLVLAGIAGVEFLLQMSFGPRLLLLPFSSRLYDGLSLNSLVVWLLGILIIASLLRFNLSMTGFDGWLILIFGLACSLFQYSFGGRELAGIAPAMGQPQIVGVNLVLSVIPLVLAIFAIFSERGRFFTPLWLSLQLLTLQPFLAGSAARAGGAGVSPGTQVGQLLLFFLTVVLVLFALRLVFYADHRQWNAIDGIAVVLVALVVSVTLWTRGQSDFQQAQSLLNTQQGTNLLSLSESLIAIAYVIGVFLILAIVFSGVSLFFKSRFGWLERAENVMHFLLILSITIGALLLLNSVGSQSSYLVADTLNPQRLSSSLPAVSVRNQYVLDGLFVLMLLIYIIALARQRWDRSFAHTERMLVLLSGITALLLLASTGLRAVLPLVSSTIQQIGRSIQPTFTAERIVALSILLASLLSLFWLIRSESLIERLLLSALFGIAALCALIYYFLASPLLLLIALLLLMSGTLIATRVEYVKNNPEPLPTPTVQQNGAAATNTTS
jgi:hypothetical protein